MLQKKAHLEPNVIYSRFPFDLNVPNFTARRLQQHHITFLDDTLSRWSGVHFLNIGCGGKRSYRS